MSRDGDRAPDGARHGKRVDHLEVEDKPTVLFRVNPNTWVDATVRYLVTPRRAGSRKTLLTHRILMRLNAEPGKVLFPKANMR